MLGQMDVPPYDKIIEVGAPLGTTCDIFGQPAEVVMDEKDVLARSKLGTTMTSSTPC